MSVSSPDRVRLETADGETLAALHVTPDETASASAGRPRTAVVMAPGFSGWSGRPPVRDLLAELHRCAPALGFLLVDLRGHGASSGRTTLGDREVFDIDAAVAEARRLGYQQVFTMGWSMGGTCVLRHAALTGGEVHGLPLRQPVDAVVTISAISRWDVRETVAMRRVHRLIGSSIGRAVARRLLHVRVARDAWIPPSATPTDAAAQVRVPLLVVHGETDHYYGWEHARALVAAAPPGATLWLVPGLGHAEDAAIRPDVPGFVGRLATALEELAAGRPAPPWTDQVPTAGSSS